jgi:hypothetical protein
MVILEEVLVLETMLVVVEALVLQDQMRENLMAVKVALEFLTQ